MNDEVVYMELSAEQTLIDKGGDIPTPRLASILLPEIDTPEIPGTKSIYHRNCSMKCLEWRMWKGLDVLYVCVQETLLTAKVRRSTLSLTTRAVFCGASK